ncbi:hypothetical protein UFOVP29_79 [uncultured Caudovirales phage]|uniref:Nuclease associated modular domain 3 n=1 Tax=uncultured Caudovirales phage TaxID=2100421 RepID=A0A6J5KRG8_9CAUD|nr:hypothetical protein UFOVP29_79 [uncultured Caudovirales phage]
MTIICPIHGVFSQRATYHMKGHKCKKCGYTISSEKNTKWKNGEKKYIPNGKICKTKEAYVNKFNKIHQNLYDYSLICENNLFDGNKLKNKGRTILKIICKKHGVFKQALADHISGNGCQSCKKERLRISTTSHNLKNRMTNEEWIERANKIHHQLYDYSLVNYTKSDCRVIVICKNHGQFIQKSSYHLSGAGCQICAKGKTSSKIGHQWLNSLNIDSLLREYTLPKTEKKYVVDGYDPSTNTVYEFLGDYWHGNPKVYSENDFMKSKKKYFHELFRQTMNRFAEITDAGYNLIYIWELDWRKQQKSFIVHDK